MKLKKIIKLVIINIILTLFMSFFVNAMPPIKTYGNIDKEKYIEYLNEIPEKYYYDLKYIKIFEDNPNGILGYYWINNGVDIFRDSGEDTLIHELAHHCQIKKGDTLYQAINHIGYFNSCEEEIWESI